MTPGVLGLLWSVVAHAQPALNDQLAVEAALSGGQTLGAVRQCGIPQDRTMIVGAGYIAIIAAGRPDEGVRLLATLLAITAKEQARPKDCASWLRRFAAIERELR